jgi:glutamyl-tRNA reductase
MKLIIVGLNHRTAPVGVREKVSFSRETIGDSLRRLTHEFGLNEGVILSTCNRVEVLALSHDQDMDKGVLQVKRFLAESSSIPLETLDEHLYSYCGADAVRHLFRVGAGLDSMVLGEPQILGQVKDSYAYAVEHDSAGVIVNKLYHKAFSVAKRIRTETKIGEAAVSISFAAVELAKKIFGDLSGNTVMLLGAGEMAELAAKHLLRAGIRELMVANRTYERAIDFVKEFGGTAIMFREFPHHLKNVDIVIASTGAKTFIIREEQVREVIRERKNRPMFFIDISVPRNVDPLVNNIDNTYVYDIDDLQGVVASNLKERSKEAEEAARIIEEEIDKFYRWIKSLDVVPTIIALRNYCDGIRKAELERALKGLNGLDAKQKKTLDAMTKAIVNKILHGPVSKLKRDADKIEGDTYIDTMRKLFDLDTQEEVQKAGSAED